MKNLVFITLILLLNQASAEDSFPEMSIYHLEGKWKTHEGKRISLSELKGKPLVAAMVYTSCQHTCPMVIRKVNDVRKSLPKKQQSKVTYALISFDPKGDTPEALAAYKKKRKLDDNWVLLTADDNAVRELASVLGVNYKPTPDGGFSHSNIVSVIDSKGVVVSQIDNLNREVTELSKKLMSLF